MAFGWIKLYRQIQESDLWDSEEEPFDRRSAWVDLLLMANHEDKTVIFKGNPIVVKAGQRITSLRKLAERWNWSLNRVNRYLDLLEKLNMIEKKSDNHKTLLTLVNYSKFQGGWNTDEYTDEYTHEYTDGTHTNTHTNTQADTQTDTKQEYKRMNKNDKRMKKNEKNEKKDIYGEYRHVRLTESEFNKLCEDFGDITALKAIDAVDKYCQETGKTYKDYNLTIRRWGIDAAKKNKEPASVSQKVDDMFAELEKKGVV